jgi:hypothetical protein
VFLRTQKAWRDSGGLTSPRMRAHLRVSLSNPRGRADLGPSTNSDECQAQVSLSVGTQEPLSTIYRITMADYLRTAVVLDDQLVQSGGLVAGDGV